MPRNRHINTWSSLYMQALEQRSPEWHELRKTKIGASDAIILMGVAPSYWSKNTPYDLWLDKQPNSPFDVEDNFAMKRGRELEPEALKLFEYMTGYLMRPEVLINPRNEWQMASLDGLDIDGRAAVEIKCGGKKNHEIALEGEIPKEYYPQLQHQISVTGLAKIYYCSYNPDHEKTISIKEVYRDEAYIENMINVERDFYTNHMLTGIPPEKKIPNIESEAWNILSDEYKRLSNRIDEDKKRQDEIRDLLLEISNGKNAQGNGISLQKIERKGIIDFKLIPEIKNVDLEKFRKPGSSFWKISEVNNDSSRTV